MFEDVRLTLKTVAVATGFSVGVQGNEHTADQEPASAAARGHARRLLGKDRSSGRRACQHKLRFLFGSVGLL